LQGFFLALRQAGAFKPFGLDEKATEKQNAQNHNYCDYDDLD
jgi:hypothetical protein